MTAGKGKAEQVPALVSTYPRKKIAKLSELKQDEPVEFEYPDEGGDYAASMLVKMGKEGGGGVGVDKDIVAYNMTCTHQGGDMTDGYKPSIKCLDLVRCICPLMT